MTIFENVSINLVFNVDAFDTFSFFQTGGIDFVIEMTNITNDSVVFHLSHMVSHNDVFVTSGGDENIGFFDDFFNW